ncbi:MAG: NAD-dependent epimerase/dehydratase family protein [Solirubrobacteraceae bacterium]
MRMFVAGASGALGAALIPILVERGHEVHGMTRTSAGRARVEAIGARATVADALDPDQVADAVARAEPEVIVHELTALSGGLDLRHFDRDFAATNRLRTEGTDNLLAAARAVGVRRFVAQSYAGWPFARTGAAVKVEDAPLDPHPAKSMRVSHDAIRHLEQAVVSAGWTDGVVLRYGGLYGPGTSLQRDGEHVEVIRRGRFPIVGSGAGMWSFVHVADAAAATVAAAEHGARGIYHVVDDEPAPVAEWLPAIAAAIGAPRPRRVPRWVGRLLAGEGVTILMTEARGASNAKARRELGWEPAHPSWRAGIPAAVA